VIDTIRAKTEDSTDLSQAQNVCGFYLDQAPTAIKTQVARALSVLGMQKLIPERLEYLFEGAYTG